MKKLFSIVLVAAGMFMSANAEVYNPTDWTGLKAALDEVIATGGNNTITLGNDITIPGTYNILYGTNPEECKSMYGAKLVINLNGHNLNNNGYSGPVFNVFNGTLEFAGNGAVESNTSEVISIRGYADNKMSSKGYLIPEHNIFWNAGEGPKDYSQLIVGQNVTLHMTLPGKDGGEKVIYVDGVRPTGKTEIDKTTKYNTDIPEKNTYFFGAPNIPYQTAYASSEARTNVVPGGGFYGMGINIIINGSVLSEGNRCIQINGSNKECPLDANGEEIPEKRNVPVITINSTAKLHASDSLIYTGTNKQGVEQWESCPAIYAAGYAEWHIYGEVIGQVGIYAKSGDFDIKGAHIESNSKTDYAEPAFKGSGTQGGDGCGIVFDNNGNYAQAMTVTISGSTQVIGSTGYAIQESVTSGGNKITSTGEFKIEGGEFIGGDAGCLEVTAELTEDIKTDGTITAGTFTDPAVLTELLDDIHGTIQVTTEGGKEVYVVTPAGGSSVADPNLGDKNTIVEMTTTTPLEIASGTVENKYLKMQNGAQLTVKAGARYVVGGMAIDQNSKIIVEPSAELVINEDGITAFSTSNIVLQANATQQASLLMNPAVTGNTKPLASIQMVTHIGPDGDDLFWGRFGLGFESLSKASRTPAVAPIFQSWSYTKDDWVPLANILTATPFTGYAVTHQNAGNGLCDVTFTFEGKLLGNNDQNINCSSAAAGWNYLANSYTGKAGTKEVLENLSTDDVEGSVYLWNVNNQSYSTITLANAEAGVFVNPGDDNINPYQTIIFRSKKANAQIGLDYSEAVWNVNMAPASTAPARVDDNNRAAIIITAANGQYDYITLTEGAEFDNEYNDGADAMKFMNENHINAYAMVNGEKQAAVATNNIEGTMISLETVEGAEYTMSFSHVNGEPMAILDVLTGAVINMEEGNVYNFVANENAVNAGRFQVRKVAEVATNVENAAVQNDIVKTIVNDQVVIIRNGVRYNTVGQRL